MIDVNNYLGEEQTGDYNIYISPRCRWQMIKVKVSICNL